MTERIGLLDTGPLVSFLAGGLEHHAWAVKQWKELRPPLLTCEPVLTEAAFLLKREGRDPEALFTLLERGAIRIALSVEQEQADLRALMRRYRNRPMSLADACLVRLSEIHGAAEVVTLDGDFPVTRTIRGLKTEVLLTEEDGMPTACAVNFDHISLSSATASEQCFAPSLTNAGPRCAKHCWPRAASMGNNQDPVAN